MAKYKIPVTITTTAEHVIGEVECDSLEDYAYKAEKLWEEQEWASPSTNCHNEFDLNDWEISPIEEEDLKFYT